MFNREAFEEMKRAEVVYLRANGWFQHEDLGDCWENEEFDRYGVTQGHAVNIQKQFDRKFSEARKRG
jgi:hypothetical protein